VKLSKGYDAKKEFLSDLPAVLLHPQTVVHSIEQKPSQGTDEFTDKFMEVTVSFTVPLNADFSSDEYDNETQTTLAPKTLQLLGAIAHSEAFLLVVETIERTETTFSTTATIAVLKMPECLYITQ
jgi:hypothetical protein